MHRIIFSYKSKYLYKAVYYFIIKHITLFIFTLKGWLSSHFLYIRVNRTNLFLCKKVFVNLQILNVLYVIIPTIDFHGLTIQSIYT